MDHPAPVVVARRCRIETRVIEPSTVVIGRLARRIGDPDDLRHRLSQFAVALPLGAANILQLARAQIVLLPTKLGVLSERLDDRLERDEIVTAVVDKEDPGLGHDKLRVLVSRSRPCRNSPISSSGRITSAFVAAIAAAGISLRTAVRGSCTTATPPSALI